MARAVRPIVVATAPGDRRIGLGVAPVAQLDRASVFGGEAGTGAPAADLPRLVGFSGELGAWAVWGVTPVWVRLRPFAGVRRARSG